MGSDLSCAVGPVAAQEQYSTFLLWHQLLLSHAFWLPCTMSQCWTGCTDRAWTWQTPDGKTRRRIDYIVLLEAWKHLQIQAFTHLACDISLGSIDHVVTAAVRDVQPIVRRRPVAFCPDLLNEPVACSVFRDQIAELPFVPWTTDPHTHAELLSRGIISCAKKAFPLNTKPRKDSVSAESWNIITSRRQARTIVFGAPHQLPCASLSLAQRFCAVNAVAAEVRDLHMRRAFALVILSNTSSRFRASLRNDRKQWHFQVQHQIQLDAAAGFPRVVFRGIPHLVKKPMVPLLSWNLKMAPVSSTSVRPPSVGCASPRSAMTVNPLRPLRFWRPLRRPVLFSPLRYDRSGYAHRFLMWCTCSVVSKPGRAWMEDLLHPDLFRRFQQALGHLFHPLHVKGLTMPPENNSNDFGSSWK